MSRVWKHSQATGNARLVLLAIADHEGEIGAWPSITTLAKMVNASESTVQRAIRELVHLGELHVELQNAPMAGQYKTNLYWVNVQGYQNDARGVKSDIQGCQNERSGVSSHDVQTLNKTIKKTLSTLLPESWSPTEAHLVYCAENNINLEDEVEKFKAHAQATGRKQKDWDASFRLWLVNAKKWSKPTSLQKPVLSSKPVDWMNPQKKG